VTVPEGTSRLWGEAGELWSSAGRLPDVSYAGYHAGERQIPTVPVKVNVRDFGAVGDGVTDDSEAFLRAIDAVSDGAVFIPDGRYLLTEVLAITKSRVVLRGESRDGTVLYFPKTLYEVLGDGGDGGPTGWSWGGGWIWVNPDTAKGDSNGPVWDEGELLSRITKTSHKGETSIEVDDVGKVEPGQLVRLVQYERDGSLTLAMHAGHQLHGRCILDRPGLQVINWLLEVEKVDGSSIDFGRPLRLDVRPEWKAELWTAVPQVEEVGIEQLTIEFPVRTYPLHHNEPGANAISLAAALNSWVRDVAILNADNGIFFWYSRYCTAEGIVIAGRGGHYGFNLGGAQDSLVTRFRLESESVHDTSVSNVANGNVFSWGKGEGINFDHHRGGSFQNVYSRIDVGRPWRQWKSSGTRSGHYTAAYETFWNIRPRARTRKLDTWPAMNIIGRIEKKARNGREWYDAWIENVDKLRPEDLHAAQLARRLGREIPPRPESPAPLPDGRAVRFDVSGPEWED
jgi:hypothetical protein